MNTEGTNSTYIHNHIACICKCEFSLCVEEGPVKNFPFTIPPIRWAKDMYWRYNTCSGYLICTWIPFLCLEKFMRIRIKLVQIASQGTSFHTRLIAWPKNGPTFRVRIKTISFLHKQWNENMIIFNYFNIVIELHILPLGVSWSSSLAIKHPCSFLLCFHCGTETSSISYVIAYILIWLFIIVTATSQIGIIKSHHAM